MNTIIGYYVLTLVGILGIAGIIARILYYKGLRDAYKDVNKEIKELIDKYESR